MKNYWGQIIGILLAVIALFVAGWFYSDHLYAQGKMMKPR